jgi:hypothetical protein
MVVVATPGSGYGDGFEGGGGLPGGDKLALGAYTQGAKQQQHPDKNPQGLAEWKNDCCVCSFFHNVPIEVKIQGTNISENTANRLSLFSQQMSLVSLFEGKWAH